MKKLKLKLDGIKEMSKDQMKKVVGGYCAATCDAGTYACCYVADGVLPLCICVINFTQPFGGQCTYGGQGYYYCALY